METDKYLYISNVELKGPAPATSSGTRRIEENPINEYV